MQGLLAKMNAQKLQNRRASRSLSVASSIDMNDNDDDDRSESESSNTLKPKVKRERKEDKEKAAPGWNTSGKEVKAKVGSRIDTNMVRLKLLDATRKAVIDKSRKPLVSTAMQTDTIKTKLCKDQYVDAQRDLVCPKDQETETDVDLIALKSKDGTVIITASIGSNTDMLTQHTVSTQTVMPRSNVSFNRILEPRHKIEYADESDVRDDSELEEDASIFQLDRIERRLKSKKKKKPKPSTKSKNFEIVIEDETDVIAIETIPTAVNSNSAKSNSNSEYEEDSIQEEYSTETVIKSGSGRRPRDSTFNSWNNLDYEDEKVELPRSCFVEGGPTPWSNFNDLVLGQRFLNARLSPIPQRIQRPNLKQVSWSDAQVKIVNDLMSEATALMDMFDQVAMMLGPDIKLHNVSDVEEFKLPPPKYDEEMSKSCEKLEASLKKLQTISDSKTT